MGRNTQPGEHTMTITDTDGHNYETDLITLSTPTPDPKEPTMSNRTIYKFPIRLTDEPTIVQAPIVEIIDAEFQGDNLFVWAEVDDGPSENFPFYVIGTGHPIPTEAADHIKTVHHQGFVWHIYTKQFWSDTERW